MKSSKRVFIALICFLLAGGIFFVVKQKTHLHQETYYCPMHPTYTSPRPGDCPICNMKLVKKERAESKQPPTSASTEKKMARQSKDICIIHNCPKLHEGRPCPMMVVAKEGEKVTCPICGTHIAKEGQWTPEKKILFWTDPMIPGYKASGPGKSPMGMDLVPVYEEESQGGQVKDIAAPEGYAAVMLTPQKQQLIGVKTAAVEKRKLIKSIRTVGTIAHDPELYQAQSEYIQAIQAFNRSKDSNIPEVVDQSQRLVQSTRIRLKHMGLSDELIDEIATWKEAEHSLLFAHPGEPVWVYAQIYEYELPLVHMGQEVMAEVPSLAGVSFKGIIRAIDPMVEQETRTTRIRIQLNDPQGQLRPDMYVNVNIQIDLGETLAIPEQAVFDTGIKKIVFVDQGNGIFEPRDVGLGAKADGYYELKNGLNAGERVVSSGNFLIDSESRLKAALTGMETGSGSEVHQHGQ